MKFFTKGYDYVRHHGLFPSLFYLARLSFMYCRRLTGIKVFALKRVNKTYDMYLDLKDKGISKALYLYGTREADQVFIARSEIKKGMRVLDIGANIGYYTLLEAALVGPGGRVYAYEPHPDNFRMLRKNVELNNFSDRVRMRQMGVSDREGAFEFFVSPKSNLHTLNPRRFHQDAKKSRFNSSIEIEVADIAGIVRDAGDIGFIRMDIEGHEVEVLNGLSAAIRDLRILPSVMFETHFPKYDNKDHDIGKTLLSLLSRGYGIEAIVSNDKSNDPLRIMGYKPEKVVKTDQMFRGIYRDVEEKDALGCICDIGGIRAVFLKPKAGGP